MWRPRSSAQRLAAIVVVAMLTIALLTTALFTGSASAAVAPVAAARAPCGPHRPPVTAVISDPFRPPAQRWGRGNRGLQYATTAGQLVQASCDGVVVFAGSIGGRLYVSIDHGAALRTTYSFLGSIRVRRGDRIRQGQIVGRAGETRFHFGARLDGAYIDPALLFGARPRIVVRLVA